ncbi:MAG: hypothetical protein COV99_05320 [Bacteroidetes bacterium CG12_big_fil_rev_8_21_14_0_65_60_17]|nr:MAG: hypothetical protein COV99_05320 [Bacteroidetes bacterium CG12_big_fil_rev_8_21_14_0_65_60_17]
MSTTLKFKLPDLHAGLTEVRGAAWFEDEFLVLEIETALMGEFSKEHKTVKIEPSALASIGFERHMLRDRIILRPKKRDLLDAVPGNHLGELVLRTKRKDRSHAEEFVVELRARQRAPKESDPS